MRMRNKPWVKGYLEEDHRYLIKNPEDYKGRWREYFNLKTINVEIGSGKGDFWLGMSDRNTDEAFIALEKEENCSAIALKKASELEMKNACWLIKDAIDMDLCFEKGEISNIYLNFSDPWPKNRNSKRRLTSDSFIDKYYDLLDDKGRIIFKTDNTRLFEYSLVTMNRKWLIEEVSLDYKSLEHNEPMTEYETRFVNEGVNIKRAVFIKR